MAEILDAYVRVSRVGGRDGEAYRSPTIQLESIQRWAQINGIGIGKVVTDEDVSGATAVAERGLGALIRRAEDGASSGIVVYRLDRFGRDLAETVVAVKRLKDANARLVTVADGYDSSQAMGSVTLGIIAGLAEFYLEGVKENWRQSTERAVGQGIHISARAPVGYLRADKADPVYDDAGKLVRNGRLVPDPETRDAVRAAFDARASGASHGEVVALLTERLGRNVAKSAATGLLRNRVYLGEARGPGGVTKPDAHEPLVPVEVWERVQARNKTYQPRRGTLAEQARLGGLITCAGCGHKLRVMGSSGSGGQREASYVCAAKFAGGDCPAPAAARVAKVDAWVADQLAGAWDDIMSDAQSAEAQWLAARELVAKRQGALDLWLDEPELTAALSPTHLKRGITARQATLDEAKRALWQMTDPGIAEDVPVLYIDGKPVLYEQWGEDAEADRRVLRRYIESVTLAKADPARRRWQPVSERVDLQWRS